MSFKARFPKPDNRGRRTRLTMHSALEPLEPRQLFAVRYVDINATGPLQDGTSWESAYTDLQYALAAATSGDEIRIADGIYLPTSGGDRTATFQLPASVQVNGGYAGAGAGNPDLRHPTIFQTVLSGDIGVELSSDDNSYHVVTSDVMGAALDGVTITAGYADGPIFGQDGGGGIYITSGNPVLTNCIIVDNYAIRSAGLLMYGSSVDATIAYTTIARNVSSSGDGAGAGSADGALTTFVSCVFEGNIASSGAGGGVYLQGSSTILDCTFRNNSALRGGGLSIEGESVQLSISNSSFLANRAVDGGAMDIASNWPLMFQCTFIGNRADSLGGALHVQTSSGGIANCIFLQNHAGAGGGAVYAVSSIDATFSNCIIWANTSPVGSQIYHSLSVTILNSDVQGGWIGAGNIDANPRFVRDPSPGGDGLWATADDDYGNLRLRPDSPCIDAGDNWAVPQGIVIDLEGNSRFIDIPGVLEPIPIVDMGTYERQLPLTAVVGPFNVDQRSIQFTFNTALQPSSLTLEDLIIQQVLPDGSLAPAVQGTGTGAIGIEPVAFSYDPVTHAAIFTLPVNLPNGNYRATIQSGSVTDTYDRLLADPLSLDFHILAADATRDRVVDARDLVVLAENWFATGMNFTQGDFNYDGVVDQGDLSLMAQNWQAAVLPPPPPPVASNPVPTIARRTAIRTPVRIVGLVV